MIEFVPNPRLALALKSMGSGDWEFFEQFAAEFLAVEYPSLRTTAAPHGDRGRDGQLYEVAEEPRVLVQYSVAVDWKGKINNTVARLAQTMPRTSRLIYATNQEIGPRADDLVSELRRERKISLDIRDQSWFVERELTAPQREAASREAITRFVDPMLVELRVKERVAQPLSREEAKIALLHLALDSEDLATGKGLTKSCFEALVMAALQGTSATSTLPTEQVIERVEVLLPAGYEARVSRLTESALARLSGKRGPVKEKKGQYHIAFGESQRVESQTAQFLLQETELERSLVDAARVVAPDHDLGDDEWRRVGDLLRKALETVLLRKGESFAQAVVTGDMKAVDADTVLSVVRSMTPSARPLVTDEHASATILEVLENPTSGTLAHLHRLADAYTMYAFLRQTPDVQKIVLTIFSDGDLWLDTTVILPLLAESLLDDPALRHHTALLRAARDAGLRLFVTDGVVEEVERHINRSLVCARTLSADWKSRIPFLFAMYIASGRARRRFASWVEEFRGHERPEEDVREYLSEVHGIERRNLIEEVATAPEDLRRVAQEYWLESHERRRRSVGEDEIDDLTKLRLVRHDVENTVGVIQLRHSSAPSPLGHRHWWLTLDNRAYAFGKVLKRELGDGAPPSPALSPDYMAQFLRLGPLRSAVERQLSAGLPILTDFSRFDYFPRELIDMAERIRNDSVGVQERVLRRRVRDSLDRAKARFGTDAQGGVRAMRERLKGSLAEQAQAKRS